MDNLKAELDSTIRTLEYLCQAIVTLEYVGYESDNRVSVIVDACQEYYAIADKTRELIVQYMSAQKAAGLPIELEYQRVYKKIGEKSES